MKVDQFRWDSNHSALVGLGILLAIWVVLCTQLFGIGIELFLPFAALSLILVAFRKDVVLILTLCSAVYVIHNKTGLDVGELGYYALLGLTILLILLPMLLEGRIQVVHPHDRWMIFIYIALFLGLVNGILTIRSIRAPLQELVFYYSAFLLYFPLRRFLNLPKFRPQLYVGLGFIMTFVVFRTILAYRTSLLNVVAEWELAVVRGAGNENILLLGFALSLATFILHPDSAIRRASLAIVLIIFSAIILTFTRSLWGVSFVAAVILISIAPWVAKKRVFRYVSIILILILGIGIFFFRDFMDLIWIMISNRLIATTAGGSIDTSLLERIRETKAAFSQVMENPILGPGLGVAYFRENVFLRITQPHLYIHNGYLAVWYKFGIIGLFSFLFLIGSIFKNSIRIYKTTPHPVVRAIAIASAIYITMAALMNITSPVFLAYEGIFVLTILAAVIAHLETRFSGRSINSGHS